MRPLGTGFQGSFVASSCSLFSLAPRNAEGSVTALWVCFSGDEDDEAPMITGFSDDVPMVIA